MSQLGQRRHRRRADLCPLYPRKRTSEPARITFDAATPAAFRSARLAQEAEGADALIFSTQQVRQLAIFTAILRASSLVSIKLRLRLAK
jgi:hypothetical protein